MKKPITVSWMRYYVLDSLENAWCNIKDFLGELRVRLIGGWYCEYCQKIHGRRVLKYKLFFIKDGVETPGNGTLSEDFKYSDRLTCSLGRDALADGTWKPERPTLANVLSQLTKSCDRLSCALQGGVDDGNSQGTQGC